jgi:hypothetical protein
LLQTLGVALAALRQFNYPLCDQSCYGAVNKTKGLQYVFKDVAHQRNLFRGKHPRLDKSADWQLRPPSLSANIRSIPKLDAKTPNLKIPSVLQPLGLLGQQGPILRNFQERDFIPGIAHLSGTRQVVLSQAPEFCRV